MKTISVDFDGVIHAYSRGWQNGECYDPPMGGAIYGLQALMEDHAVFILSTRKPQQISEWFTKHAPEIKTKIIDDRQPFWNEKGVIGITNQKLAAMVYIDDRSYLFKDWATVIADRPVFADYPKSVLVPKP